MQVSESAQKLSVSCWDRLPLAFTDNRQIQESDSALNTNAPNTLATGSTFRVSLFLRAV